MFAYKLVVSFMNFMFSGDPPILFQLCC